jgi:hypothetical protein
MQLKGTIHVSGLLEQAEDVYSGREEDAIARLGEQEIDSFRSIIGAGDTADLLRKIVRFAAVSSEPGAALARLFRQDPGAFVVMSFELASYRLFMDRLAAGGEGVRVKAIVDDIERCQRDWVADLVARFRHPLDLLPRQQTEAPRS